MSDNKLLNESTVRRFMKLANVESLTDNFISEMGMGKVPPAKKGQKGEEHPAKAYDGVKEETAEEEVIEEQDEDPIDEPEAEDPMDEPAMDDMDMGDDADEMGPADISLTEEEAQLLIDLGERLKEAMGDAEDVADDDMADLEMDEPGDEDAAKIYEGVTKDELVQEILKRVTKRIVSKRVNN